MITKAAVLEEIGKPLIIRDLEIPPLDVGQVLVEVHKSTICGRQIGEASGAKGPDKYLPHLMGHEGGGVVLLAGPGVTNVKEGDHVVMHWRKGIGIDAIPPKYPCGMDYVGAGPIATFTELAVVSENRLTPISDDIDLSIASLMGCAVTTGLGLINNEAKLKIGQSIAVIGCGGVGLNVIQGAAMVSAYPIYAIDKNNEKLDIAQEYGASDISLSIAEIDDGLYFGEGINVVVECTGIPDLIEDAYRWTAPGGKTILVGQPPIGADVEFYMAQHFTGKTLMDSQGGLTNPTVDIPRYVELYRQKKLKLDRLITHSFPLDDINKAFDVVKEGNCGKVMLEMK